MPYANKEDHLKNCKERYYANREKMIQNSVESFRKRMQDPEYAEAQKAKTRKRHHERKHDAKYIEMKKLSAIKTKLKTQYGITEEQYWEMHSNQQGKCSICGEAPEKGITGSKRTLAIDHCHTTKKIRGLLCGQCNIMLGIAKDNKLILMKAIDYLTKD